MLIQALAAILLLAARQQPASSAGTRPSEPQQTNTPPTVTTLAPDEIEDPELAVDTSERRFFTEWKQHPSIRYGSRFRLDFEAKLQEDGHWSYPGALGLNCGNTILPTTCVWELHRNRIGIQGHVFKRIDYEVERELTEQELTEKDLLAGYMSQSLWKDVAPSTQI